MTSLRTAAACVGVTLALSVAAVQVKADDIPGPPDAPCTLAQRMNVHIVEGWMYECGCQVLAHGFHCEWNLVGQVAESSASRKFRKRHSHRRLIPVLVIKRVVA